MKKLSNFIKYPLVLASVCVISAGSLGLVNYLCEPINIAREDELARGAVYSIFGKENIEKFQQEIILNDDKFIFEITELTMKDKSTSYAYKAKSDKGYSGTFTYLVGIKDAKIVGYKFISSNEDILGTIIISSDEAMKMLNGADKSTLSESLKSVTQAAGATAKATIPAFKRSLDYIFDDFTVRFGEQK